MLLLAAAPAIGFSQTASKLEAQVAQEIAQCMAEGPPDDWERLYMIVELDEPGAPAGRVRYVAEGKTSTQQTAYVPCDPQKPAKILMDARQEQSAERRGWTGARLVIHRSGRFDLNYDYPR